MSNNDYLACWSCAKQTPKQDFFCSYCNVVQPPHETTAFSKLGLCASFAINHNDLEKAYFYWQAKLHPDKFSMRSEREKLYSLQQSAELNKAYETLRGSVKRAEYLLALLEKDGYQSSPAHDPVVLIEIMEKQENLEKAVSLETADQLRRDTDQQIDAITRTLASVFESGDVLKARQTTERLKYLTKFLRQCEDKQRYLESA